MILELWWKSNASDLLTFIDDNLVHLVTHVCWWTHPLFLVAERLLVFCVIPLFGTFLSGPLNWALFWAKLLNWALFWANPLVWALFWALKKAYLLLRARFWVVLLFWALKKALKRVKPLKIALKKALKFSQNLPPKCFSAETLESNLIIGFSSRPSFLLSVSTKHYLSLDLFLLVENMSVLNCIFHVHFYAYFPQNEHIDKMMAGVQYWRR